MIGRIRGILLEKYPPYLLLDVGGLGYEVTAPMTTFYDLPDLNQEITLYTHFVVREDAHTLYGFKSESDRRLFRALIKVNGIGPKLALTILSGIEPNQFVHCVIHNDVSQLVSIPGIGRKTAERLMMETKDVLASWPSKNDRSISESVVSSDTQHRQDAVNALVALGYKPKEAQHAIDRIQEPCTCEELIRLALKQMVTGEIP